MSIDLKNTFYLVDPQRPSEDYLACTAQVEKNFHQLEPLTKAGRARDIAIALGITEAQWIAAARDRLKSYPLQGDVGTMLDRVGKLGEVLAITRNHACVHECKGEYKNISKEENIILLHGEIELRLFINRFKTIWAVAEFDRYSLQFFDQSGAAVHKIYCTEKTDMDAYHLLVKDYAASALSWPYPVCQPRLEIAKKVDQPEVLREIWLNLKDTHDFFGMIRRFKITRVAACEAVGTKLAQKISVTKLEKILIDVAHKAVPIMCFVANAGAIQIYTGSIHTLYRRGAWYNIMDPGFNLHLNTDVIETVWIICKPTLDGWVTSVEAYDETQELVVQFFGERKPGVPELSDWRKIVRQYCEHDLITDQVPAESSNIH